MSNNPEQCSTTCPVCNHPQIKSITKAINAGVGHSEITKKFGGFGLRTLETHISSQPGITSHRQVDEALKEVVAKLPKLTDKSSDEARFLLSQKLLAAVERTEVIAIENGYLKAEQQLGELILKASNLLSTLDYDALPDQGQDITGLST